MFLALKEMARAKTRFGLLVAAIALLVFLILFQQSLQNGLITGFVGAIRNQNAPVLVYSVDGQRVIQGSIIPPDLEAELRATDGVGELGRIGQGTFTGQLTRADATFDATIIGYELGSDGQGLGAPSELVDGRYPMGDLEAVASTGGDFEFAVGDTVVLQPGGFTVEVVGLADDIQLNVAPTLFTSYGTWSDAVRSVNPDAGEPLPNVMAAAPADGVTDEELVDAINARSLDFDAQGNLWVAMREGNQVFKFDLKAGKIHHVGGTGAKGFTGNGGPAKLATLSGPKGIAIDAEGNAWLADTESHSVRMIEARTGNLLLMAGTGEKGDGPADSKSADPLQCKMARLHGIFVDQDGAVYIGDSEAHRVRVLRRK